MGFPRPPAPLVGPKPMLPRPCRLFSETLEDMTKNLLAAAVTEDGPSLIRYPGAGDLLLAAIDPLTRDSALHRAAAVGNIGFMSAIPMSFGRNLDQRPSVERLLWVLMVHQNLAGDTALHAAARVGNLRGVKAVYRLFHYADLDVDDEMSGPDSEEIPAEDWDWGPVEDDPYATVPALAFVCTKNRAGRDAAAEARAGWS